LEFYLNLWRRDTEQSLLRRVEKVRLEDQN
jgi:hypothetical protein